MDKKSINKKIFRLLVSYYYSILVLSLLIPFYMPQFFKMADIVRIKTKYKTEINLYNKIINNLKEIFEQLNITDPIEIFAIYTNLYSSGALSNTLGFNYYDDFSVVKEINGGLGMNIVKGEGFCRHVATFLDDLLKAMGYESYIITSNFGKEEKIFQYNGIYKIPKEGNDNFFTNLISNHAYNLVFYNEKVYILDATNKMIFRYSENGVLNIINGSGNTYFKLLGGCFNKFYDLNTSTKIRNIINNFPSPDKEEVLENLNRGIKKYEEVVNEFRYNIDIEAVEELKKRLILIDRR